MRFKKFALWTVGIVLGAGILIAAVLVVLFWSIPVGTLTDAAAKVRAHRDDIRRISNIIQHDPALVWVTTDSSGPANGLPTRQTASDYSAISAMLTHANFGGIHVVRDRGPDHKLLVMSFGVFDPSWFSNYKPIYAEWTAPSERLAEHNQSGTKCTAVDDGWFVCSDS